MQLKELASVRHSGGYFYYWLLFPGEVGATRHLIFFSYILFIYLRARHKQVEGAEGEGAADSPPSREPNVGLLPGTLRSRPD